MGRDDEAREKDGANAETTRGAHACRHTAVAGVALCLALAAAVAFAGRRGGIASRPAAALGERYVNECNLFGCRTVHAQLPPRRLAAVPGIQQELSGRRPLGSSALVQHRTDQPTTLAGAASKLKALEQELVKENATAVAAWNAVSVIHRDMQTIEDQTHVDGVEIRRQHALLAHEEGLLGKEMGKESTEKSGLAAARTQLRQARERQARVLAEAQKYRAALTAATQKLVSFKKAASARDAKLRSQLLMAEEHELPKEVFQTQQQQANVHHAESEQANGPHLSQDEIVERLEEDVHKLEKELAAREEVIQLQQQVIKTQAVEVKTMEKAAKENEDEKAGSIQAVMNSAEAASAGEGVKDQEDEERENAEIIAKHPGIDPSSIPSVFSHPEPLPASHPEPLPAAEDWRKFGDEPLSSNPQIVGENGVVGERNFAAGVTGAHGTVPSAEEKAEEEAATKAEAALEAFDAEEEASKQQTADSIAFGGLLGHTSAHTQAEQQARDSEVEFQKTFAHGIVPDQNAIEQYVNNAEMEREKTAIAVEEEREHEQIAAQHLDSEGERAEAAVHGMLRLTGSGKQVANATSSSYKGQKIMTVGAKSASDAKIFLHHKDHVSFEKVMTAVDHSAGVKKSLSLRNGPWKKLERAVPKKMIEKTDNKHSAPAELESVPAKFREVKLPSLHRLATKAELGGIAGEPSHSAGAAVVMPDQTEPHKNAKVWFQTRPGVWGIPAATAEKLVQSAENRGMFSTSVTSTALAAKAAGIADFIVDHAATDPDIVKEKSKSKEVENKTLPKIHRAAPNGRKTAELVPRHAHPQPLKRPRGASHSIVQAGSEMIPSKKVAQEGREESQGNAHSGLAVSEVASKDDGTILHDKRPAQPHTPVTVIDSPQQDVKRAAKYLDSYNFLNPANPAGDLTLADVPVMRMDRHKSVAQAMAKLEHAEKAARPKWEDSGLAVKASAILAGRVIPQGHQQKLVELPADMRGGLHIGKVFERGQARRSVTFRDNNIGAPSRESSLDWRVKQAEERVKRAETEEQEAASERHVESRKAKLAEQKATQLAHEAQRRLQKMIAAEGKIAVPTHKVHTGIVNQAHTGSVILPQDRSMPSNAKIAGISASRQQGDPASSGPRYAWPAPETAAAGARQVDGLPQVIGKWNEAVGGPIQSKLAHEIAHDLNMLRGLASSRATNDINKDTKAALQDLHQISQSEKALLDPPPLKFAVKIPVGGLPGRQMEVHLPDGRTQMVIIPKGVSPGQMLEVDAPRPLPP